MKFIRTLFATLVLVGLAAPAMAQVQNDSERPGSVLVFHKFINGRVDGPGSGPRSSFEISVTCPTGSEPCTQEAAVKLKALWVCPGSQQPARKRICAATDFELHTTVKGTLWFNPVNAEQALSPKRSSGDVQRPNVARPPCQRGFLIVWAVDNAGRPISFNALIGNAILRDSARDARAYNAYPIQAVNPVAGTVLSTSTTASLAFNGLGNNYALVPGNIMGTVRYERFATGTVGEIQTDLTLLTLDVLANRANPVTIVPLVFYNERELPISTSAEFICWFEERLTFLQPDLTTNTPGGGQGFGGQGAVKGLVESFATATQQDLNPPFATRPATLIGIVETKERNVGTLAPATDRSYSYNLFNDGVGVPTRFCHNSSAACPAP